MVIRFIKQTLMDIALVDGTLREKDPTNGNDLYLTIDSGLQRNLDYLMSNAYSESGAEVVTAGVMEIKPGKILAMSTYPSFNPNERYTQHSTTIF